MLSIRLDSSQRKIVIANQKHLLSLISWPMFLWLWLLKGLPAYIVIRDDLYPTVTLA